MKKFAVVLLSIMMIVSSIVGTIVVPAGGIQPVSAEGPTPTPTSVVVTFPDTNLERAIRVAINKPTGDIYQSDLAGLIEFNANLMAIADLTGIEHCIGLTSINVWGNDITDISPLSSLSNLSVLYLGGNRISDLSPLSGLTKLYLLDLSSNHVSDISPLAGLVSLGDLWLCDNQISDISPLSGITSLYRLVLSGNQISDISPLSGLTSLWQLDLRNNLISDMQPLVSNNGLASGDTIEIRGNPLSAVSIETYVPALKSRGIVVFYSSPAPDEVVVFPDRNLERAVRHSTKGLEEGKEIHQSDLDNLQYICGEEYGITNLAGLERCHNLCYLDLSGNRISNISALSELTNLEGLNLAANRISDISVLSDHKTLGQLELGMNQISDISALSGLTRLETLGLGWNEIGDISALSGLTNLIGIYLPFNRIGDISPLSGLTRLSWLLLGGNQITDISALSGLTNLGQLELWSNQISDTSPLAGLANLGYIDLNDNAISDLSVLADLINLTAIQLGDNEISDIEPLVNNLGLDSVNHHIDLRGNPLSDVSQNIYIPALVSRGISVDYVTSGSGAIRTFPDPRLERVVRSQIGKAAGDIYQSDLDALTYLYASYYGICDLTGLEYCGNLTSLYLDGNQISDLSSLSGFASLQDLSLAGNQISNLTPLTGLTNLSNLDLSGNQISDLSALLGLTNLSSLDLSDNQVNEISALASLTNLGNLVLSNNQISDLSALVGLTNLSSLYLWSNKVSNIEALSGLANLNELDLYGNQISNISAISGLTSLFYLHLENNRISDIRSLVDGGGIDGGETVFLTNNPLSQDSVNIYIPALQDQGATVFYTAEESAITFPDPNLEQAIRDAISKPTGDIYQADLTGLTALDASNRNIQDITGLEYCTDLQVLWLSGNQISDISPLSDLADLHLLDVMDNPLNDISCLANLTNLQELHLEGTQIGDISPLANLTSLKQLFIVGGSFSDVSALANLINLQALCLNNNQVSDISVLGSLTNLCWLDLGHNPITNISVLTNLPYLQGLCLEEVPVSDISVLADLTSLQTLFLLSDPISDISVLAQLTSLQKLWLGADPISDISILASLPNLRSLTLDGLPVSDFSVLAGLTGLQELEIDHSQISDISILSGLTSLLYFCVDQSLINNVSVVSGFTNLTELDILNSRISNISMLSSLSKVQSLCLDGNQISDISVLADFVSLQSLSLADNEISDISPLSGLTNLEGISLYSNQISDISPLVDNSGLADGDYVNLSANPISATSVNTYIPALQARGVTVDYTAPMPDEVVTFADSNLEQAIRDTIGKPSGDIYQSDLDRLTCLFASSLGVNNLTGLEHCTNLDRLLLSNNQISDISALSGLTRFGRLYLDNNQISNISALSDLTSPECLQLSYNQISDISPLSGLTGVAWLYLGNNQISNISALSGITGLGWLDLEYNQISNIPDLSGLTNLWSLNLCNNQISDISGLSAGFGSILYFYLSNNQINDIPDMSGLTNLLLLEMDNNQISNISGLSGLTHLARLNLSHNQISDIPDLSGLTNLADLYLDNNQISDISALASLTNLQCLILNGNQISDISPLVNNSGLADGDYVDLRANPLSATSVDTYIPALQARGVTVEYTPVTVITFPDSRLEQVIRYTIDMPTGDIYQSDLDGITSLLCGYSNITNLSGIEHCTNLRLLDLHSNQLSDISALSNLTGLLYLDISNNQISDISALLGLTNLQILSLGNNQLTDIPDLSGLTSLTTLTLDGNRIDNFLNLSGIPNLGGLCLSNNQISDISGLSTLVSLRDLGLDSNNISDISALSGLTNLRNLNIDNNQVSDLSVLADLPNLWYLSLAHNEISDIKPLIYISGLSGGATIDLMGDPLSLDSVNTYIPELEARGVTVYYGPAAYTQRGNNVVVQPQDSSTQTTPVAITFNSVIETGETSLTVNSSGPIPPAGFSLGDLPTYYDISTTASYTGSITICISYNTTQYSNPDALQLLHYENDAWVDVTTSNDVINGVICGNVTSLSPFVIAFPVGEELINVTVDTLDQYGNHIDGTVSVDGWGTHPSPYTGVVANGGNIWPGASALYRGAGPGYVRVWKDTTVTVDARGRDLVVTSESTPGVNAVNFVFEVMNLTVDTLDQYGNHIDGTVSVDGWGTHPSPYTGVVANGGNIWPGAIALYRGAGPGYVRVWKDTTVTVDARGRDLVVTSESTPGVNAVNFVFEVMNLTVDTLDQYGNHIDGTVSVDGWGTHPSSYTGVVANGGAIWLGVSTLYGGGTVGYTRVWKDTTLIVDFRGQDMVVTSDSTPGINAISGIFEAAISATIDAGADATINEGSIFISSGLLTASAPSMWTVAVYYGDGTGSQPLALDGNTFNLNHIYVENGTYTVTVIATNSAGGQVTDTVNVTVNNVAPVVGQIVAPADPLKVNTPVNASVAFTDAGVLDTHTAIWEWGDDSMSNGVVNETGGSGSVGGNHTYTSAGVYTVKVTITDQDETSADSVFRYIVVYDPGAGFVTGGGWINSPVGAYTLDPLLTGKADFGFVSQYKKGASVPTGQTEFQFKVGNLDFHSTGYQWLVIAGAKAQYKGSGSINGVGDYGFMLTAIDGQVKKGGDGIDRFRIKIWDKSTSHVIYDNQMGAPEDGNPTTAIAGGSIVIHS